MRKFMILTAATAALTAAPAFAATTAAAVTGTVDITGEVTGRCKFTTDNVVLPLGELSDAGTGELDTSRVNAKFADLAGWCNAAASEMSVEAKPILGPSFTGDAATFSNRVDYTATANLTPGLSVPPSDASDTAGAGTAAAIGLYSGNIRVTLSGATAGGSKKMVAGNYTGQVIVTLTPKFVAS
jgi:hypothetical protein